MFLDFKVQEKRHFTNTLLVYYKTDCKTDCTD